LGIFDLVLGGRGFSSLREHGSVIALAAGDDPVGGVALLHANGALLEFFAFAAALELFNRAWDRWGEAFWGGAWILKLVGVVVEPWPSGHWLRQEADSRSMQIQMFDQGKRRIHSAPDRPRSIASRHGEG
jgi:hypothetical protein